jgi:hypothetical protein
MTEKKIVNYKILLEQSEKYLAVQVGINIDAGWQPQGGVAVSTRYFYQAMVQYEE